MAMQHSVRFNFCVDAHLNDGPNNMSVTYVGRVNRKSAAADAERRFQEWQRLPSVLAKRWSQDQVVVNY